MIETILAAALSYAATNIDDLFINMLFFAQADTPKKARSVVSGKYLGIGALFFVSLAASRLLHALPLAHLNLLGVVPIALGVRAWLRRDEEESSDAPASAAGSLLFSTALITVANGADNIGVYMPLFSGYAPWQIVICAAVFPLLTAVWCRLGTRLCDLPGLRGFLLQYRQVLVPAVLIALGVYILI